MVADLFVLGNLLFQYLKTAFYLNSKLYTYIVASFPVEDLNFWYSQIAQLFSICLDLVCSCNVSVALFRESSLCCSISLLGKLKFKNVDVFQFQAHTSKLSAIYSLSDKTLAHVRRAFLVKPSSDDTQVLWLADRLRSTSDLKYL